MTCLFHISMMQILADDGATHLFPQTIDWPDNIYTVSTMAHFLQGLCGTHPAVSKRIIKADHHLAAG
ncbi:Uncharacterised protein [Mycobacterium tuberculosis]|nr:Uncharacterised protein [Mycobacterium tuberculosis]